MNSTFTIIFVTVIAAISFSLLLSEHLILNDKVDPISLIEKYGYYGESYLLQTKDGYTLELYRILKDQNAVPKGFPVLLMNAMGLGPAEWIAGNGDQVLSHMLSDMGYDVWIGSTRGSLCSRKHSYLTAENSTSFWDFSFHEIGVYDLPAIINYILSKTQKKQLIYVGYSQGTTSLFVMLSMFPDMNSKIRLFVALAPAAIFQTHGLYDKTHRIVTSNIILKTLNYLGYHYFIPFDRIWQFYEVFCKGKIGTKLGCTFSLWLITSNFNEENINWKINILNNTNAIISTKQIEHYHQLYTAGKFVQYDYGQEKNLLKYGTKFPPEYNLSNVNIPWGIYYSKGDDNISHKDMETLIGLLPDKGMVRKYLVPCDKFDHGDFIYSKDVALLLYDDVVELIKNHSSE